MPPTVAASLATASVIAAIVQPASEPRLRGTKTTICIADSKHRQTNPPTDGGREAGSEDGRTGGRTKRGNRAGLSECMTSRSNISSSSSSSRSSLRPVNRANNRNTSVMARRPTFGGAMIRRRTCVARSHRNRPKQSESQTARCENLYVTRMNISGSKTNGK